MGPESWESLPCSFRDTMDGMHKELAAGAGRDVGPSHVMQQFVSASVLDGKCVGSSCPSIRPAEVLLPCCVSRFQDSEAGSGDEKAGESFASAAGRSLRILYFGHWRGPKMFKIRISCA